MREDKKRALEALPTPCYVIDEERLEKNCQILAGVMERTGAKILLAQKAYSAFATYPLIGCYLSGCTASGLFEARLGREEMNKENHIFSPAYRMQDMPEILSICDHISFNSVSQLRSYGKMAKAAGVSVGIRVNPECSTQEGHEIYDPCAPGSRLGATRESLCAAGIISPASETGGCGILGNAVGSECSGEELAGLLDGLHFHTLCEQNSDALARTLDSVEESFSELLKRLSWINLGGGHHITREDYDIALLEACIKRLQDRYGLTVYLEPGEAVALNAGYLVTEVLDFVENHGIVNAILDASAACHMPDVLEMPYRPPLYGSGKCGELGYDYRLGSCTCLAGDIIGDYSFSEPLKVGDRLIFSDMAIYSMVKNNTFNGMPLPSIYKIASNAECSLIREFGYEDFRSRLS